MGRHQGQVKVTPCWLCHQNMAQLSPTVWYSEAPVKIARLRDSGRSGPWEVAPGLGVLVQAPLSEPPHFRFFKKKNVPASWCQLLFLPPVDGKARKGSDHGLFTPHPHCLNIYGA